MTIYDFNEGLSMGRDTPYGKWTQPYGIKIQGPGSGKIKALITGAGIVGGYVAKHYKFFTGVGVVAIGAGVASLGGTSNNQFGETFRTFSSSGSYKWRKNKLFCARCYKRAYKCRQCQGRKPRKGHVRRNMGRWGYR